MKKVNKKVVGISIAVILFMIAIIVAIPKVNRMIKVSKITDPETLRAMTYEQFTDSDKKVDNCDYVEFSAFFTRDLDGDGYAEKIKGTCREISQTDTLYAEINVLTQGHFDGGMITVNGDNFTWNTAIVEDSIVDGDYIGETKEIKLKNELKPGSQKLLWGTIKSKIGNNKNDYSKENSITLTGTYYDDEGNPTEINKTIEFPVDWYGETKTEVNKYYYSLSNYQSYQNQMLDIATIVKENSIDLSFKIAVSETKQKLLLKKQEAQITIPELNGYKPLEVLVEENKIDKNYNEETGILTITRSAEEDDNGEITKTVAKSNLYNVTVKYPIEAYDQMTADSVVLNIPVKGINEGYNNPSSEFSNPYTSTAEGILTVTYSKPSGDIWNIYPTVGNNERVSGAYNTYRYQISKEAPTDIFNGNVYEDKTTTYPVRWEVVIGDYTAINKINLEEQNVNDNKKSDEFLSSSNSYSSMYDYVTTTGVYFDRVGSALGSDGWIKLYNAETDSLLETFNSSTWGSYTKENPYSVNIKTLRIETSKPVSNTSFSVYQIKEVDDELIAESFSQEDFERLSYVYTYLKGTIDAPEGVTYDNGTTTSEINKANSAYYDAPYSVAELSVNPNQITNQKTENVTFTITTSSQNSLEKAWVNGAFLIELPDSIINASVNRVEISDESIQLGSCDVVEENGRYFIKIYTQNEEEKLYTITVNASITGNPLNPTENKSVKLYAYNENCNNYYNKNSDEHDLDNDRRTDDSIGYSSVGLNLIAPSGLLTTEYVTNYDDNENSMTIAPNVADIEKSDETRTANINVSITNGYSGTISDIVILGKIPFEGNTYVLNGGDLNSNFTANITGQISIPESLKEYTTIYYSKNESVNKDLNDESNEWILSDEVTDWSEIKSYIIDMGEYTLRKEENDVFMYEVKVSAGLGYNSASFSSHAVYYNLDTENGKLAVQTEPNKVGIQVIAKYSLQLTKNKKAYDNMLVQGATYSVTTKDVDGNEITKTATTNEIGILTLKGLYVDREYTLREISAPSDYAVSTDEIVFEGKIESNGNLAFDVKQGKFKEVLDEEGNVISTVQVEIDENQNYIVKAGIEDDAKYSLKINKIDKDGIPISGVSFILRGREKGSRVYKTDDSGVVVINGLCPEAEYELQEIKAEGYYTDEEPRKFKIIRDDTGILKVQTSDEKLKNEIKDENITELDTVNNAEVVANIVNEKIPTYTLQIMKVEENLDEENVENLKKLYGAKFKFVGEDTQQRNEYTVDTSGIIEINGLYEKVDGRYITGNYTIQETRAPEGYANNAEEINFHVQRDTNGELSIEVENPNALTSLKNTIIEGDIVKLIIEDKPLFKITKVDSSTGKLLENAKFVIYEIDSVGKEIDYARDIYGDYVGELNLENDYVVTTDQNGQISVPLRPGSYKIEEVGYPEGYYENSTIEFFKVQGNDEYEGKEIIEINYIEDLVDLSNAVNNGNTYSNTVFKLVRTLDFKDSKSYRDYASTTYGDLNKNGIRENIMTELTNTNSIGFTPIGTGKYDSSGSYDSLKYFSGIFDGQNYSILNLYEKPRPEETFKNNINYQNVVCAGLFGRAQNAEIKNVTVTGLVTAEKTYNAYLGGVVGYSSGTKVTNCHNKCSVNVSEAYNARVGGIVGESGGDVIACSNTGNIVCTCNIVFNLYVGGIVGEQWGYKIENCFNKGTVVGVNFSSAINNYPSSSSFRSEVYAGGITGYTSGTIKNCYNEGIVTSNNASNADRATYAGGIVASMGSSIENCYSTGNVNATKYATRLANVRNINNSYYLSTSTISGSNIDNTGIAVSSIEMMSEDFYNTLNVDNVWVYENNGYPKLINEIMTDITEVTELKIENTIKKYDITTDVDEINGVKGGTISGEDSESYENVIIHEENQKEIVMTPNNGYEIIKVTINGQIISISTNEDGSYTIPAGYFKDITENKHVVVTYAPTAQTLTINKIDEDTNQKLQGAEFSIRKSGTDITNNLNRQNQYYFQNYNGIYMPDNGKVSEGINSSKANSFINLYNLEDGKYFVRINASISSEETNDFGWATLKENNPSYDSSTDRIFYLSGEVEAQDYESEVFEVLPESQTNYYVCFGYEKNENISQGEDALSINKVTLCKIENDESVTEVDITYKMSQFNQYDFRINDGKYIPTNSGTYSVANSTANSFVSLYGLTSGVDYYVEIDAEISSEPGNDYGYATISYGNQNTSEEGNNINEFMKISGDIGRTIYRSDIFTYTGTYSYYLNVGYHKNESINGDRDAFKIYSIKLYRVDDSYTVKTNEEGIAKIMTTSDSYEIQETKAPEGYTLDSERKTVEIELGKENSITITNKHKTGLLVHHYFKDKTKEGSEQYTTIKVAEDEYQEGDINQDYTTSPRFDLYNLYLEKSGDGKYITPANASGKFGDSLIEVNYYYELKPIELKINHYLEGTTNSLADEKVEEFFSELTFDEEGKYEITANGSYKIDNNEDYNNLINDRYELVKIESTVNPELNAEDTLSFTENAELTYYYKLKEHKITTEVKAHIESRTNEVTNEKEDSVVKGGQITGEEADVYEIVENGENSEKIITATPDEGYVITKITLDSINGDDIAETVLFDLENNIEEPSPDAEISYTKNADGSITLSTFDNVVEDKHIVVEFNVVPGTVIVHHYIIGTGEEYEVEPVRVVQKDGITEMPDEIKNDYIGESYATKVSDNISKRYKLVLTSGETSGTYTEDEKHVYYYYNLDDFPYSVHYFYDGVEKEEYIENGEKLRYGSVVSEYIDKADGYHFDKVVPADYSDKTKTTLTITENEEQNVINVYYLSEVKVETEVITHTETYKDGTIVENVKGGNVYEIYNDEEKKEHEPETVLYSKNSTKEIIIVPDEDYEIVSIKLIANDSETKLDIASLVSEDGTVTLNSENGYFTDLRNDVKVEVEFRKKSKVIVKYLAVNEFDENGNNLVLATEEVVEGYENKVVDTENKFVQYYVNSDPTITDENKKEIESKVTMTADEQTVIYWYEKAKSGVVVRHIEITEEDIKNGVTLDSGITLDIEQKTGEIFTTETVTRNIYSEANGVTQNEKYKNYISVDGPKSNDEILFIVSKDENSQDIIYPEDIVVEVRFYYIRQYRITTEVKTHNEEGQDVKGGTISGDGENAYEVINKKGSNQKEIVIKPDEGYRVKSVTTNGVMIDISSLEDEEHKIVLGAEYFKEVTEDKYIVVEFEKIIIPATPDVEEKGGEIGEADDIKLEKDAEKKIVQGNIVRATDGIKSVPTGDNIYKFIVLMLVSVIIGIGTRFKKGNNE